MLCYDDIYDSTGIWSQWEIASISATAIWGNQAFGLTDLSDAYMITTLVVSGAWSSVSRGGKTHDREIRIAVVAAFCHGGATVVTGMVDIGDVIAGVIARFARKLHGLRESCKYSENILLRHSQKCPVPLKNSPRYEHSIAQMQQKGVHLICTKKGYI